MGNVGLYSIGKEMWKAHKIGWQCISRVVQVASHSWDAITHL